MEVLNVSLTKEVESALLASEAVVQLWRNARTYTMTGTLAVSLFGLLGNFLSFSVADFMPKSNSGVFMKYLALWDSMAVIHYGVLPALEFINLDFFNQQVIPLSCLFNVILTKIIKKPRFTNFLFLYSRS